MTNLPDDLQLRTRQDPGDKKNHHPRFRFERPNGAACCDEWHPSPESSARCWRRLVAGLHPICSICDEPAVGRADEDAILLPPDRGMVQRGEAVCAGHAAVTRGGTDLVPAPLRRAG